MENKLKSNKAVTMVALVVTIVVLLILAGVIILEATGNGLIAHARKATFLSKMRGYQETVEFYTQARFMDINVIQGEEQLVSVGLEGQESIETVIKNIEEEYKDQVIVQKDTMYYKYNGEKKNKERVKWCFETGIPVWEYASYEDFLHDVTSAPITRGEYTAVGNLYMCAPNLTGFNINTTYYVTYDDKCENETIANNLKTGAPENITDWYNYNTDTKKWANIVTQNEGKMAYFVWIPRYVYKIDNATKKADIKFVDINNNYIDFETGEITNYPDTEPQYDADGNQTNYCLSEAFIWDGNQISGYWVSKYNVSEDTYIEDAMYSMTDTSITVEKISTVGESSGSPNSLSYDIYVDDELVGESITSIPYTITKELNPDQEYTIKIEEKHRNSNSVMSTREDKVKTLKAPIKELTKPNLMGFDLNSTYYVTYDSAGENETIGDKIQVDGNGNPTNAPEGWYDYENKIWANIVTISGDKKAYFTWIPRYEYKVIDTWKMAEIRFIPVSQTTPTEGYQISEAFTWDGNQISGYWVSKYNVSEDTYITDTMYSMTDTSITLEKILTAGESGGSQNSLSYDIYVDDELVGESITSIPYKIAKELNPDQEYTIKIEEKHRSSNSVMSTREDKVKTLKASVKELTRPNLMGFDLNSTYYVTYDSAGENETIGDKIQVDENGNPTNAPEGWYDYENKIWANIVTISGDKKAYFTWIPRYEYKVKDTWKMAEIRFIPVSQTTPTEGYQISEAFIWDGNQISGYWVSKYEVSE